MRVRLSVGRAICALQGGRMKSDVRILVVDDNHHI